MLTKIYEECSSLFPILGGATGAASQASKITEYFPHWEMIISTIVISAIGALVGYIVKLILDRIFCPKKK